MAHFYGHVRGSGQSRRAISRLGTRNGGLEVIAASWQGAVKTTLFLADGRDIALVELVPWHGQGVRRILYEGPVDAPLEDTRSAAE